MAVILGEQDEIAQGAAGRGRGGGLAQTVGVTTRNFPETKKIRAFKIFLVNCVKHVDTRSNTSQTR